MATMMEHERRLARAGHRQRKRARLRGEVLRVGELLGWPARDIIRFTEALVQHAWRQCGAVEFAAVLEEERSLLGAVVAKAARRTAREQARALRAWMVNAAAAAEGTRHADHH
jgi:hypothetical protein